MDKINFVVNKKRFVSFDFKEQEIIVNSYLSEELKLDLANKYFAFMFNEENLINGYFQAEWSLILGIVEACTNIKVFHEDEDESFDLNNLIESGLWHKISENIENYKEFRNQLKEIQNLSNAQKRIGKKILEILSKVSDLIDQISSLDLSEDGIAKLIEGFNSEIEKFSNKFPGDLENASKPKRGRPKKTG